ncbi:helix-turn-helix domain-containing protein [Bacillus sp. NTK034]|uniref:helix-turn-helix domain-containing protein n=1 Tax=Bacillus sp. NTK034 TaxID=2802176 RepID=UPI001A8EE213|nr:helix-turn-helix domain-containing protein [Bacillus sp. NTK034]MBN8200488.1 helix-turn-helix domain-containing protein [Bacillus sp. NTK034]
MTAKRGRSFKKKDGERVQKHITWTDEEKEYLQKLKEENPEWSYRQLAEHLTHTYGTLFTWNGVRNRIRRDKAKKENEIATTGYKETVEILQDGSHKSDKLLQMDANQAKDVKYLLKAHGFDVNEWELVTAKNNIWNVYSKEDKVQTLYSSKITAKPKVNGVNWDEVVRKLKAIKPIHIERQSAEGELYLSLPLFDMHFGPSTLETHKGTQSEIYHLLDKGYKEVLFIIGQDMLHTDDFRGRTASGREIGKINFPKAWKDAAMFYEPIIKKALKTSNVKIMYSKGNHDESMSWAFVQYLKARFPQAEYDDSFRERKVHMLGLNFVGVNHGDKKKDAKLSENFSTEFPLEWARAKTREIFTGHLHHERVLDTGGALIRRMPTGNEIDDYHDDYGYTTAHKRFQVFEYTEEAVKSIHYV